MRTDAQVQVTGATVLFSFLLSFPFSAAFVRGSSRWGWSCISGSTGRCAWASSPWRYSSCTSPSSRRNGRARGSAGRPTDFSGSGGDCAPSRRSPPAATTRPGEHVGRTAGGRPLSGARVPSVRRHGPPALPARLRHRHGDRATGPRDRGRGQLPRLRRAPHPGHYAEERSPWPVDYLPDGRARRVVDSRRAIGLRSCDVPAPGDLPRFGRSGARATLRAPGPRK